MKKVEITLSFSLLGTVFNADYSTNSRAVSRAVTPKFSS